MKAKIKIATSAPISAVECAAFIVKTLAGAEQPSSFAISGGSTPKLLFAELAKSALDWSRIHIFWVDERCVPPTDSQSNFRMANETLLQPAHIPATNIHRIFGELSPADGAARYRADIEAHFGPGIPVFDVLHRGMGPDCHTASLFPSEPLINDRLGVAANVWVEKMQMHRVTLLPGVLLAAKNTVLQVAGPDKAEALRQVLYEPENFNRYPCQIASRDERAIWFVDQTAAAQLP